MYEAKYRILLIQIMMYLTKNFPVILGVFNQEERSKLWQNNI